MQLPVLLLVCALSALPLPAQEKPPSTAPTVTFTLDFPKSEPSHYFISISSDGHASYESNGKLTLDSDVTDPFTLQFTASPEATTRVFDLAKKAHYFHGDLASKNRNIAFTGDKTLTYSEGQTNNRATYNYSPIPAVTELTGFLQNLSNTLEFGHRLQYYHRYQKLALDSELKSMEEAFKDNSLPELGAIAPILQQIVADHSVMNVVRSRAQRLLILAGLPTTLPAAAAPATKN